MQIISRHPPASPIIKINDFVEIGEGNVIMSPLAIGPDVKIKAAGGIRTIEDAAAMIYAGADRIGSSAVAPLLWKIVR